MWFLIKTGLTFAMVLVGLSYFSGRPVAEVSGSQQIEMQDAVSAAAQAYQYLSAICIEKPQVCEKGAESIAVLGQRAKEGARVAFELLDKQFADDTPAVAEVANPQPMPEKPLTTASTRPLLAETDGAPATTVPLPMKRPAQN
ncbi:DUF5330 domain-containing protein [Pseudorhizobium flavum]|uniref:DUF5330 domain-containing protein n=1 Tax=Pseudorhizobium flavum TaxID=1335061 RepID=A0A7W9YYZ0_9HYPH|nr:DUF5330 domain-containing protein [Pseudorhizobium flavum]MBB6180915.1 hypothetical protein [Pseudorhizobium flavum]CAD6602097.1 hypothetical protein RFYW14_01039 [Pseudorhizobium flavum]